MARVRYSRKVLFEKQADLTIADTTATELFTLPSGAIPIRVSCFTATASVGATLDVGIASDSDQYIDGMDISGAGMSVGTLLVMTQLTEPAGIVALIGGGPGAGGGFTIVFEFTSVKSTGPK